MENTTEPNYYDTLITVARDCPSAGSAQPPARGTKATVALIQYELVSRNPYGLTQPDVLFESWLRRQDSSEELTSAERAELRARFFAKPQACLRASPLPKRYGWGLLFDREGRVALCPMESEEYHRLVTRPPQGLRILGAMRSSRARS